MSVRFVAGGQFTVMQQMKLLKMPAMRRKRLLAQVGRRVRSLSRKRIRAQKGLDGKAWEPRKNKQVKRKMLKELGKKIAVFSTPRKVDITFASPSTGKIARQHQEGIEEVMTAAKVMAQNGSTDEDEPATRAQARALRDAGYKIRRKNGKGWKLTSLKHVVQNMTMKQAGLVLRILRDEDSVKRWVVPTPIRSFLGATQKDVNEFTQIIFDQTLQQIKRAK